MNKESALRYYYQNREKRLVYQREYDKENKEKKNAYEREKRRGKVYNYKKKIQHYSQKYHLPILIEKYKECQLKLFGCIKNKELQIHHKKYTKKIEDCLLVCENCHRNIHRKQNL